MQDYINLINFLKENDEEVKKDLEELRFGCKYKIEGENFIRKYDESEELDYGNKYGEYGIRVKDLDVEGIIENIIGNNLEYNHLMMYCNNTKLLQFNFYGDYIFIKNVMESGKDSGLIEIDITKTLHEQKSEVYKQLLDYFIGLQ